MVFLISILYFVFLNEGVGGPVWRMKKCNQFDIIGEKCHFLTEEKQLILFFSPHITQSYYRTRHPSLEREDRLRKHPFAGFGTVMEDIKRTSYTKKSADSIGISVRKRVFCVLHYKIKQGGGLQIVLLK